jgi:glycosyltransferase involved in cell wall biosynthesis
MRVALVHDFLREYGGAERVLEVLHDLFPQAPVYTAFVDQQALGRHWPRFADWDLRSTWFSHLPWHKRLYSPLRFLAPHAFAHLDLSSYDLVISSSNAFMAKAVRVPHGLHLCYCHTPPRSLYGYSTMSAWKKNFMIAAGGKLINLYMHRWDQRSAQAVDYFIANSQETQGRIQRFYQRQAEVIYPPVAVETIQRQASQGLDQARDYYFYIGRLGLQKHPELAVRVCARLDLPLKVAGTGPMLEPLQQLAAQIVAERGEQGQTAEPDSSQDLKQDSSFMSSQASHKIGNIEFLGAVSDKQLWQLYAGARALLYPVEDEDFGMVPVEAMAAGTPVIAHRSGGPQETILEGKTGLFIDDFQALSLGQAIKRCEQTSWDHHFISQHALQFNRARFQFKVNRLVASLTPAS